MHSGGRDDAFRVVKWPFCASESLRGAQLAPTPARAPRSTARVAVCAHLVAWGRSWAFLKRNCDV